MRSLLPFSMGLAIAATACVAATRPGAPKQTPMGAQSAAGLNPARAADRQLIAFGEAHPQCRMWTNWEKLCSRIGAGGAVLCVVDPDRRVSPSTPFCAAGPGNELNQRTRPERASSERFCRRWSEGRSGPAEPVPTVRLCTHQDPARPFNGRRIAALMAPGCDGLADAETGRPFCVRGGDPVARISDCAALAASRYEHSRWLQCSRWSGERSCRAYPITREQLSGSATAFGARDPNLSRVHGLFCENR